MKLKNKVLKSLATMAYKSAVSAAGTASQYGTYQPVEPKKVSMLKKN